MTDMLSVWEKQEKLANWWEYGEQEKPLIMASICEDPPALPEDLTLFWEDNRLRYDLFEQRIARTEYLGVAIPFCYIDFGSSCMAGSLGCPMRYMSHDTVWPHNCLTDINEILSVRLQKDSAWYNKVYDYFQLSLPRRDVMTTCYSLGGIGDTIGSLYGEGNLLMDMVENPESVKMAFRHIKEIWIQEYEKQVSLIKQSGQTGMCGFSGVWAPGGTFPMQEDMSYSISPDMFDQFSLPELTDIYDVMEYPSYHLDGKNAVVHLESLLGIEKLKVIQWVPGASHEEITQWYPLLKRILDAGKSVEIFAKAVELEDIVHNLGSRGVLIQVADASNDSRHYIERFLLT